MFTPNRLNTSMAASPMLSRNVNLLNRRSSIGSSMMDSSTYRSPFAGSRRQSKNFSFGCLNQTFQNSILVAESPNYIIEAFGASLPVLVTEALTLSERNLHISVKLSETGWAWLVCNRRLFIWKYKLTPGTRSYCKELTLPPSDLAHKADLVCVFLNRESQTPSAIAVSPEGIVRYWSSIAHEVTSSETAVDLQGQECFSLTNIQPLGCILATTTSSLVQVIPTIIDGQHTIVIQTLKVPQGVLAGISRRVSSFIFGAMPNQSSESKQLSRVLGEDNDDDEEAKNLYVLSGSSLQKWLLIADEPEKMCYEVDMDRTLKDEILQAFSCQETVHVNQLKTWFIDIQLCLKGLLILAACINPQDDQQISYFILIADRNVPGQLLSFTVVKHTEQFTEWNEDQLLGFSFVMPDLKSQVAYFYNQHKVLCVPLSKHNTEVDVLEFMSYEDRIIGCGTCEKLPLFFSSVNGILSVVNVAADTSFLPSQSLLETSKEENIQDLGESNDKTAKLRAAFLYFCRNDLIKAQGIVEDDFLVSIGGTPRIDSFLDQAVISLSQEMIDDYPASDPRWADSFVERSSVTSSLLLLKQLNDKLKAHNLLLNFLKNVGLWQHLYQITMRGLPTCTRLLLCEHAEKLKAATSLGNLTSDILQQAIERVLSTRKTDIPSKLTPQDMFFREVSIIDDIYLALSDSEQDGSSEHSDLVSHVTSINTVFLESLQSAYQFRQSNAHLYEVECQAVQPEYVPWTSTDGPSGLRTILIKQYELTTEHLNSNSETILPSFIHQQLLDMADLILEGYRYQLQSVKQNEDRFEELSQKYFQDRTELLTPLLEADQHERATALAEKYCDFGILVKICEKTNNQNRLQRYMNQFADQGFADFVFKWYLEEGKRGKLLSQPSSQNEELTRFLADHESLSWLHHFNTGHYGIAHNQLKNMAGEEKHLMNRKKTMLSLSKLALLAGEEPPSIRKKALDEINVEQDLILYQETLPAPVLQSCGLDLDTMRVLAPEEMIELYISEDNSESNEYDFKKALDLLDFCQKNDTSALRLHIWSQAIFKDAWDALDTNNPLESIRNTIFFRVIDLAFTQGVDMQTFLIPLESLTQSPELGLLASDPKFVFLLKAGYEQVNQLLT